MYIKLVYLFVGLNSMLQGFVETKPNLVWIFRGFGMKLFIRHIFKKWSPDEEKKKSSCPMKKEPEKLWLGGQCSGVSFQAECSRFDSPKT